MQEARVALAVGKGLVHSWWFGSRGQEDLTLAMGNAVRIRPILFSMAQCMLKKYGEQEALALKAQTDTIKLARRRAVATHTTYKNLETQLSAFNELAVR